MDRVVLAAADRVPDLAARAEALVPAALEVARVVRVLAAVRTFGNQPAAPAPVVQEPAAAEELDLAVVVLEPEAALEPAAAPVVVERELAAELVLVAAPEMVAGQPALAAVPAKVHMLESG